MRLTPSDLLLEKEGKWFDYFGTELRIRRLQPAELSAHKRAHPDESHEPWVPHMAALAATVLIEWRNFPGDVEPTPANMLRLMEDDTDARIFVLNMASAVQRFIKEQGDAAVGNSLDASNGS